jgi:Protein of unknown function (DUF3225)
MTIHPAQINHPETHREIADLYPQYERALVENDVATLTRLFWASPLAMRFGVTENLYGIDDIEAFRKSRPGTGLARRILRLDIVTFGPDHASVTIEFERTTPARIVHGRQSQLWVRLPEGWRITAAHVSLLP